MHDLAQDGRAFAGVRRLEGVVVCKAPSLDLAFLDGAVDIVAEGGGIELELSVKPFTPDTDAIDGTPPKKSTAGGS